MKIIIILFVICVWVWCGLIAGRISAGAFTYKSPYSNYWDMTIIPAVLVGPIALVSELFTNPWGWNVKLLSKKEAWEAHQKRWPSLPYSDFERGWGPMERGIGIDIHPIKE